MKTLKLSLWLMAPPRGVPKLIFAFLFCSVFLMRTAHSQVQQRVGFFNGKHIDYTTGTVSSTPYVTVEGTGDHVATNGVVDGNRNRLFNINGELLYAPQFAPPTGPGGGYGIDIQHGFGWYVRPEIAICPKPASCDSFYVFYSQRHYDASSGCSNYQLSYALVDPDNLDDPFNAITVVNLFDRPVQGSHDFFCPTPPALALSKEKVISGVKTRQLFVLDFETGNNYYDHKFFLRRYDVTDAGVSGPTTLFTHPAGFDRLHNYELELSPDGTTLAYGRSRNTTLAGTFTNEPTKDIVLYHLNSDGSLNSSFGASGVTFIDIPHATNYEESVVGVEFAPNSTRLFASVANDAIYYIDNLTSSTPTVTSISGTQNYTFSQLELIYSGGTPYIAVAKNQSDIHFVQSITGTPSINTSATYTGVNVPEHTDYPIVANGSSTPTARFLFTLPDQVDGEDYSAATGGWFDPFKSTGCCIRQSVPHFDEVVAVTGNNTPTSNQFNNINNVIIKEEFRVPAGVICTLSSGMTLRFHPGASLIIEPTGRLYMQTGAHLTGLDCGTTWEGVRVLGNPAQAQTLAFQGYLNMQGGSTISHARIGAATYNEAAGGTTQSGGLIQTLDANFINNFQDLAIPGYSFTANNFFEITDFIVDNNYRFGTAMGNRAVVSQISSVYFRGCTFANDNTSLQSSANNVTIGIFALSAGITLDRKIISGVTTRSVARKMQVGVLSVNYTGSQPFTVQFTDFDDNKYGIYSSGINNFSILENTFDENNANFTTNTGVFVDGGTGWVIRNNTFAGSGGTTSATPQSYGTVIRNTNVVAPANLGVYRNTFEDLYCANQSEGINRGQLDTDAGLVYTCNLQDDNLFDQRVLIDASYVTSSPTRNQGIRHEQRVGPTLNLTADNTYSGNSSLVNGHT